MRTHVKSYSIYLAILFCLSYMVVLAEDYCSTPEVLTHLPVVVEEEDSEWVAHVRPSDVTITVYNPTSDQCDDTPLVTASGRHIDLDHLKEGRLRWCAVSRDLLGTYHYGDTLEIWIAPNHEFNGLWLVADCMAKRHQSSIDLLTYDRKVGKWAGFLL